MNLANIVFDTTEKFPDRTAIIFYDRKITYTELADITGRFTTALSSMGIGPGSRVALAMPNVPEFAFAFFAVLATGAEAIAVNPLYTQREIEYYFEDAGISLAIAHPMFAEAISGAAAKFNAKLIFSDSMGDPEKFDISAAIKDISTSSKPVEKQPRDTALIVYTNAYLGDPLGACLTHGGLLFDANACISGANVDEHDVLLSVLPLFHAFSLTVCLNLPVLTGGTTILHELYNEERVLKDLETMNISLFPGVPTMFQRLLDKFGTAGKDFSSVKAFVPGGAPPTSDTMLQDLRTAFKANVFEGYGITECGPVTSVNPIKERFFKDKSIGLPLQDIKVKIIGDDGSELPVGETGELAVKGENVMEKYLNRPDQTEKFLVDGWLHTGDLAHLDEDGYIFLHGVKKRMIIVGGFNVYPAEVEREINRHPDVQDCNVFGAPDASLGERPAATVTLKPGAELSRVKLQKFLRLSLAPYKIPRKIEFT